MCASISIRHCAFQVVVPLITTFGVKKLQAAAGEARKKLGYQAYHFMYATFLNLRCHPRIIRDAVEVTSSQDTYNSNYSGIKRAKDSREL